jgi:hypothetical protein
VTEQLGLGFPPSLFRPSSCELCFCLCYCYKVVMCDCQVTAHVECLHVVQRYVYRTQIELYSLYLKLIQLKLLNVLPWLSDSL